VYVKGNLTGIPGEGSNPARGHYCGATRLYFSENSDPNAGPLNAENKDYYPADGFYPPDPDNKVRRHTHNYLSNFEDPYLRTGVGPY